MKRKISKKINYDYDIKLIDRNSLDIDFSSYVMGVDIGGTYTNFGIAGINDKKPVLLFSIKFSSKELDSLSPAIVQALSYAKNEHNIDVYDACIGAAGIVSEKKDFSDLTNLNWNVNTKEIIKNTSLKNVFVINDFQAIGYGINSLDHYNKDDILNVRMTSKNKCHAGQTRAIIGGGTGFSYS
jgi:glucokinase